MKIFRNHWYDFGLISLAVALVALIVTWGSTGMLQKLAILNFIAINWHQFEEYRFPGGEPAITNLAMQPKSDTAFDRYPLNQNIAMIINVGLTFTLYLFPIFFPNVIWLGMAPVVFGMGQLIVHGIITPKKIGNRLYSPGMGGVLGHVAVGIVWFYYTISNRLIHWTDIVFAVLCLAFCMGVVMMKIGYGVLSKPDSKYPFPEEEFERSGYAERIRKIKRNKA